ncbi:hypothetical protein [Sphingobacterium sp. IITKGP-BTPF85]|uniref:hypothetical protein n=1 Tax=Sphingobacterium sp. IITKGP-BTPF85 TaxID=1338009 RepID=UPI00038A4CE5|nr:hypothetical protein [Sphingobacterium sp. IITKGP-BTPF85]KKX48336.1 hypothetical protein L950_0221530 [Sphingobacterium sp. IITKGP-BTPF85]
MDTSEVNKLSVSVNEIGDEITGANKEVIKPKTDDKELKNTILSISEMEDLLKKLRDDQKVQKTH